MDMSTMYNTDVTMNTSTYKSKERSSIVSPDNM